ncbi:MAG: universal stress protein [Chloroflexi bacterium]|nr:universal stress protein [Chloroflexota bacterium]
MAISGILVPLDGAAIAASVLPTVAAFARPMRAAVHLVAAVDLRKREIPSLYYGADEGDRPGHEDTAPLVPRGTRADAQRRVERARSYLAALAGRLQALGIESSYEANIGDPMTDIVRLARRKRFGMIALSPHSRYAIGRGLGSVTDKVLHSSPIPILIAPPLTDSSPRTSDLAIRTVIVGLDGSRAAEVAFGPARQISEDCDAKVVLLRAVGGRGREEAWAAGAERVGRDIDADFETHVQEYLQDASERIGVPCVTVIGNGDEVTEILTASQDRPAAIIVMASQGQSGLTKWRLGSITDRVIRETTRPVVVVPPILAR